MITYSITAEYLKADPPIEIRQNFGNLPREVVLDLAEAMRKSECFDYVSVLRSETERVA